MLRTVLLLLAAVLLADPRAAFAQPVNLDFEDGEIGATPDGWFVPAACAAEGFTARLFAHDARTGARAVRLVHPPEAQPCCSAQF